MPMPCREAHGEHSVVENRTLSVSASLICISMWDPSLQGDPQKNITYRVRQTFCPLSTISCSLAAVAHTGFSYGVGIVSSPGPYPEKAPPLFLFSSNLRYIIFQNDILITFCIPQKIFIKGRRSGPGAGPLRSVGEK